MTLYYFQVYNIIIRYLFTLQSDHHGMSSEHLSPFTHFAQIHSPLVTTHLKWTRKGIQWESPWGTHRGTGNMNVSPSVIPDSCHARKGLTRPVLSAASQMPMASVSAKAGVVSIIHDSVSLKTGRCLRVTSLD